MTDELSDEVADQLLSACRTAVGDELRSLTYFTRDDYRHIYLREDLERGPDPLAFVETERMGFASQDTYEWSELGEYKFTVRAFENGYVVRVIGDDSGAYATTDSLTMDLFWEVAEAMQQILEEYEG